MLHFHPSQHQHRSSFPNNTRMAFPATSHKPAFPSCSTVTLFGIQSLPSNNSHRWGRCQREQVTFPSPKPSRFHTQQIPHVGWPSRKPRGPDIYQKSQPSRECAASAKSSEKPKKKVWEKTTSVFQIMWQKLWLRLYVPRSGHQTSCWKQKKKNTVKGCYFKVKAGTEFFLQNE